MRESEESREDYYRRVFGFPGIKVVDTSFVTLSHRSDVHGVNLYCKRQEREEYVFANSEKLRSICAALNKSVTFPEETLAELRRGIKELEKLIKRNEKDFRKKKIIRRKISARRGDARCDDRRFQDEMTAEAEDVRKILSERKNALKIFSENRTEDYISNEVREYLENIIAAVSEIVLDLRDSVSLKRHRGVKASLPEHEGNDGRIFAKAYVLSLSYTDNCTILTCDGGFEEMRKALRNKLKSLSVKYDFPASDREIHVFYRSPLESGILKAAYWKERRRELTGLREDSYE